MANDRVDPAAVQAFVKALPKAAREKLPSPDTLAEVLSEVVRRATKRWPGVAVPPAGYLGHVARHLKGAADPLALLAKLKCEDLYLAVACARQSVGAIGALEALVGEDARRALAALRLDAAAQDEVMQRLRARLFVADGAPESRILGYGGQGPLGAWVCAVAVRLALDLRRQTRGTDEVDEQMADQLSNPADFELAYIKQRYRKEFRAAFQESFRALEADERNLLRFNFIDGLNIEQIGAMTGVHRSTVARRIARIREVLFEGTRRALEKRFKLSRSELNSLLKLVKSDFDVSLREVLGDPAPR